MNRMTVPFVLIAFAAGLWIGASFLGSDSSAREDIDRLSGRIDALEEAFGPDPGPSGEPDGLAVWLERAGTATRQNAEEVTESLVKTAEGRVEGAVADAVLHLLRDGTRIPRCFVMRGIADGGVRELDPRVVARCLEIARSVPASDYDSHYFFAFLLPVVDPKSDELVDFVMDRALRSALNTHEYLDTLRAGLTDEQLARCAEKIMARAEKAGDARIRASLLRTLLWLARPDHVKRLEAMAGNEEFEERTRSLAQLAAKNARKLP